MMGHCLFNFNLSASCVFGVMCLAVGMESFRISSSEPILNCPRKKLFINTNGVAMCKRCPVCPAGYGLNSKCNLEKDTTCAPCLSGTFSYRGARYCKKCRTCKRHEITVRKCTEEQDTKCRKCKHGSFSFKQQKCKKCKKCRPGHYVFKKCSRVRNSVCKRCPRGMFSSEYSLNSTCVPCRVCGENFTTIRPCTRKMDTLCSSCQTGYFPHKTTGECSQCVECRTDFPGYTIRVNECSRNNNDSYRHCMSLVNNPIPFNTITKDVKANVKEDQRLLSLFMKFVIGGSVLILLAVVFAISVIFVNHRRTMKSIGKNKILERYYANNSEENTASWVFKNCYLSDVIRSSSAPSVYLSYELCDDQKERSHSFSISKFEDR